VAWTGAAVVATTAIVTLAVHGRRPDSGLVRFQAAGVMVHIAPERVREIELTAGERHWRFARVPTGGWSVTGPRLPSTDWPSLIDEGLRFLSVSAPQRVMTEEEYAGTPPGEFGLGPARYAVLVRAPETEPFAIEFGSFNALGLGQYARVAGRVELFLLPRFVGEPWEKAAGLR
jgi:hypothetical protein